MADNDANTGNPQAIPRADDCGCADDREPRTPRNMPTTGKPACEQPIGQDPAERGGLTRPADEDDEERGRADQRGRRNWQAEEAVQI